MKKYLFAALIALAPFPASAQFFGDLNCYTNPERCVPVTTLKPDAAATTGQVLTVQSDGSVAAEDAAAGGGGGAGDIEGVTAGIALSGGGTTGTVTLNVDIHSGVGAVTNLQGGDDFLISDESNADGTRRVTYSHISSHVRDDITGADIPTNSITEDKMADDSIGHNELTLNSVRGPEVQALAISAGKLSNALQARICPDPTSGTSGQVCATNGTALVYLDQTGGGGGGTPATSEQRIESVSFADAANITSTASTLTLAATTPVAVEFGDGAAEMLTGTGGETTFTIAESGVYLIRFEAVYPADGDRTTPFVEIQDNSDDSVIGRSTTAYLRNSGSPEDGLTIVLTGIVTVPTDALVVKAVLANAYNQNSMDADGGKLSLVRINSGLRGGWPTATMGLTVRPDQRDRLAPTGLARRSASTR